MATASNVVDFHREVSLMLLKSGVGYAVRTPKGQKDPGHLGMQGGWDPSANSPEKSSQNIVALERNDDNLAVHLFGAYVDVDVDTDNPLMAPALDYFLPATSHVWGRASRPRTHRLYGVSLPGVSPEAAYDPTAYPFLRMLSKHPDINVEIRGGDKRSGQYSLLPGSLHPSGEAYEWADVASAKATPATVDLMRVINGVRFACAVCAIAPYWTEGNRNALCMALSGFMHRAASHCEELNTGLEFTKREAEDILRGLMSVSGDDETDYNMRIKTFSTTWDKADAGSPVSGATTIAKLTGNPDLIGILYALLTDNPDLIAFDEFMARYAIRNNSSTVIDLEKVGVANIQSIMSMQDFHNSNLHRTITNGSTGEKRKMTAMLVHSQRAIRVDGLAFIPGQPEIAEKDGGKFVNAWRGFQIEPAPVATDEDVALFLDYVHENVANNDKGAAEWVLDWLADIFQRPESKCGTALVLVGLPGSGKTFLGEKVMRRIIGRNHSLSSNSMENLLKSFNADSANKVFIVCNEALNSRRRQDASRLKSMITDETRRIEPKGIDPFEVEDCARYAFTSNDESDAIAIVDGEADRRYTVIKTNDRYAEKSTLDRESKATYWRKMHEWASNDENLAKLHRWLLDRKFDRFNIQRPYTTEAKRVIAQHSQRGFNDWLMQIVNYEHPLENLRRVDQRTEESFVFRDRKWVPTLGEWPSFISYTRLEESYKQYAKNKGASGMPAYNAQQIKSEFEKRGLLLDTSVKRVDYKYEEWENGQPVEREKRLRLMAMPTREHIASYLKDSLGYIADLSEGETISASDDKPSGKPQPDF